jgi:hypothetical protein
MSELHFLFKMRSQFFFIIALVQQSLGDAVPPKAEKGQQMGPNNERTVDPRQQGLQVNPRFQAQQMEPRPQVVPNGGVFNPYQGPVVNSGIKEGRIPYNPEKQGGMQNNLGREMLLETAFGTLALAGAQVKRMFTLMNNLNMKSNPDTMTQTSIPEAPFMSLGMTPKGNFNNFAEKDILLLLATINAQAQVLKSLEIEFNFLQSQAKPNSEIKGMNNPIAVVQAQGIPQGAKPEGTTPPGAILANLAQAVQQNQPAGVQKGLPEALKTPPLQAAPGPLTEIAAAGTVQALPEAIKT